MYILTGNTVATGLCNLMSDGFSLLCVSTHALETAVLLTL
jgi:hypothetical protein